MDIRPIRNEADYEWALAEVEPYFVNEPTPGSAEADRFDVLSTLIEAYERDQWPAKSLSPIEALREFMSLTGKTQSDLAKLLGYRSRASDILLGRRKLTVEMIGKLNREWHVPAELLVAPHGNSVEAA